MSAYFIKQADLEDAQAVIAVHICRPDGLDAFLEKLSEPQKKYVIAHGFKASAGQTVLVPDVRGDVACVAFGAGVENGFANSELQVGVLGQNLGEGFYRIASAPANWSTPLTATAWGMGAYKFSKYLKKNPTPPTLILTDDMEADETWAIVRALHNGRDYINTPAGDMGPVALHGAAQDLADRFGASLTAIVGDDLLSENYPMIHAVGRAAHEAPRLVELVWGDASAPHLALVGKGITFDTGGLNMKGPAGMRIMKKDMGGAAHVLALAEMIMAAGLPVRLHAFLAIAENAVSADAFRPGDVLSSRKGLTVEIDNTDAEGRLVLGDALTRASEGKPDLLIDFATLTGAARVALGPTLAPFFSNREAPVASLLKSGDTHADPFWHMPLWAPYMSLLKSPIADMKNAGSGFAGAVTAALFLQKFAGEQPWMHFDVYGWNPTASAAHPQGGEIMTARAVFHWLKDGGLEKLS
ncbi:MAG: leucyl aminopeptidase [Robiginitomaculum sp.]|nr:MAG: leucyl aminopeptidase [Robiginitomaculum sp.]